MNPIADLVIRFQEWVMQVPEILQPFIIALAGAIPFIEGEGSAAIGIIGGLNPIVAAVAGAIGNFLCVLLVVLLSSGVRGAAVNRINRGKDADAPVKEESKGRARFRRMLVRFGVPGASLLGPIAMPTQFTAAFLVGTGVRRGWVLLWQGIAIVLWTTLITLVITGVISAATA